MIMEEKAPDASRIFWEVELKKLNESLPRERRHISELLIEPKPLYRSLSGEEVLMNREEVSEFAKAIPKEKLGLVRLPIVIVREASMKRGSYLIDGNEVEIEAVNRVLDRPPYDNKYLFRPDVMELIRRFPTIIAFGFIM